MVSFQFKDEKAMLRLSPMECSDGMDFIAKLYDSQHLHHNCRPTASNTSATSVLERHLSFPRDVDYERNFQGHEHYYLNWSTGHALFDSVKAVYHLAGSIAASCRWMNIYWDAKDPFGKPDILDQMYWKAVKIPPFDRYYKLISTYQAPFSSLESVQRFGHEVQFWVICTTQILRLWAIHEQVPGLEKYFIPDFSRSLALASA
ncbi:hypothetical protein FRC09_014555, partial [Ceratobasidium sp. 395]